MTKSHPNIQSLINNLTLLFSGYGTVGRNSANGGGGGGGGGGGMASMMDEMQKTLARRRAKVDRSSEEPDSGEAGDQSKEKGGSPGKPYPVSGGGSQAGSESPKPGTVSQLSCQHSHTVSH